MSLMIAELSDARVLQRELDAAQHELALLLRRHNELARRLTVAEFERDAALRMAEEAAERRVSVY
jgi:predicted Holliday junction resolvase-like endonuclease